MKFNKDSIFVFPKVVEHVVEETSKLMEENDVLGVDLQVGTITGTDGRKYKVEICINPLREEGEFIAYDSISAETFVPMVADIDD